MDMYPESDQSVAAASLPETPDRPASQIGFVSIVIAAFNEEDGIARTIEDVRRTMSESTHDYEIIIVDDGSEDKTAERTRQAGARLIQHDMNRGYGASLKTGIRAAKGDWIVITDADGTYPNDRIPDLLKYAGENDMVVGARLGGASKIPLIRRPVKWLL
ncbi:MAG: glycosyltransferase family 2 protein, partial [Nitrospinota bacterium]|nr:glycosyltransferase family 2 protein [Nitrospinota bacterium]